MAMPIRAPQMRPWIFEPLPLALSGASMKQFKGIMTLDDIPGGSPETITARLPAHLLL
jgi:hypothetical protein